jgi:protein-disulfide isomerase
MSTRLERLGDLATVLVGLSAVVVGIVVVLDRTGTQSSPGNDPVEIPGWQEYAESGHRLGPSDALVTIVEFGDYQCPACRGWNPQLEAILRKYPKDVALVYRHWPLPQHQYAYPAARAAECAHAQGRFWEYHRLLYSEDNWLGDAFVRMASEAGVNDIATFEACVWDETPVQQIQTDIAAAEALGGRGTPTIIVNGMMLGSARDSLAIEGMILKVVRAADGAE